MKKLVLYSPVAAALLFAAGCETPIAEKFRRLPNVNYSSGPERTREVSLTPQAIPGTPRYTNNNTTGGYGASNVQAQLKINVKDGTKEIKVIRDNTDPYVITKPYLITKADPYAVRSYLEAAVGARSVNASPVQAMAVKYNDGKGVLLVSAEEYRFADSDTARGIDSIVASLDRPGLAFLPEADTHVYFPRHSRAFNLRDMLQKVGSSELDPEFCSNPSTMVVDGELNALLIKAPKWEFVEMSRLLAKYDRPIPEIKISYRVIEIYAENDDRIGVDFQSWKNNEGVDLFSAGTFTSRNWGTFFTSGPQRTGNNNVSYWNFNPKWNTRYLDFMTSISKAKCLAQGVIVAQNRVTSNIQVNSGFFYDRTSYVEGATTLEEAFDEFAYTQPNPNTVQRESVTKIMALDDLKNLYQEMGVSTYLVPSGYTMRTMGTQTGTNTYSDAIAKATYTKLLAQYIAAGKGYEEAAALASAQADSATSGLSKYLTGYISSDGTIHSGNYNNMDWNSVNASPGIIHGSIQYPMVTDGFKFNLNVTPVITGNAAKIKFDLSSISLLGWNCDGSARSSASSVATTVQVGYQSQDFVIGGLKKSESVRSTAGLPYFKDLPVIGRVFSTESESIKQSQLVLVARVELSHANDTTGAQIRENLGKIVNDVNQGMTSRVGNMFFQQLGLDPDRKDRLDRLDRVGNMISDEYVERK